jgi:Phage integrase, N-terminal SAM-like domain
VTAIAPTMQAFFTERLARQRRASPYTIAAYRDTLRLLLGFAAARTGTPPCRLDIADLNAPVISAFLDHLERDRGNSIRSRNARLAAIHSLFGFAALRHPEHAAGIARVLAIPPKRADQTIVTFLTACCPALKVPMREALCVPVVRGEKTPPGVAAAGFSSVRCRSLSAWCRWCQSTTSVTAERAAGSSTRFLPEANAATRDCRARLLTARG